MVSTAGFDETPGQPLIPNTALSIETPYRAADIFKFTKTQPKATDIQKSTKTHNHVINLVDFNQTPPIGEIMKQGPIPIEDLYVQLPKTGIKIRWVRDHFSNGEYEEVK